MTASDGYTGSQLAEIRHRRHLERAERRGEQLEARRAEVLSPEFMRAALTSKAGLRHVHAAIGLHAHGQIGGLTVRELRRAVEGLFANGDARRTKAEARQAPAAPPGDEPVRLAAAPLPAELAVVEMPSTLDTRTGRICARCGGPLVESGRARRCRPCRTAERAEQRARQRDRKAYDQSTANLRHAAERGAELTEDDMRRLVDDEGPAAIDCGDDYSLMERIGALQVPTADLVAADHLWATGQARAVLQRGGITAKQFASMTGVSARMVGYWLAGTNLPKHSRLRNRVAAALLDIRFGNDDEDAVLVAHGHQPTIDAAKAFYPHEPYEHPEPWTVCAGCKKHRQQSRHRYGR